MKCTFRILLGMLLVALSLPVLAGGLFSSATTITEPTPTASDYFGYGEPSGVSLSADGQTALVAASYATVGANGYSGKAYIWHYANGKWTQMQEIDDPDNTADDYFGYALALSADGKSALIGSCASVKGASDAGKAYIYTLNNGTWTKSQEFDDPAATADDYFGCYSVSLSGDGSVAAIGDYGTTVNAATYAGEAYIYALVNGSWTQQAAIKDPDGVQDDEFSLPLTVSEDGQSVLVGSRASVGGNSDAGKAYLYTVNNGSWSLAHEFDDPDALADEFFGSSGVSLSNDGKTAIIGAYGVTVNAVAYAGAAYVYTNSNGTWSSASAIQDPDGQTDDYFGYPVSLSGDGTAALIGSGAAVNGQSAAGKAYLYTLSAGTWSKAKEFDDPAAHASDDFGQYGAALSGDGETAFISAAYATVNGQTYAGEAYLYQSPDDLSVSMSANPASVTAGQQSTLDVTVTNTDSSVTANMLMLTDTLPKGLSYVNSSAAGGTCSASGATVNCTLASLAPGNTWQPAITVMTTNTPNAATYSDSASVTSNQPDPNSANNSATTNIQAKGFSSPGYSSGGGAFGWLVLGLLGSLLGFVRKRRS